MAETLPWKIKSPSVLFVNPSMGTKRYERQDALRGYLSIGTLASALRDKTFLKKFAHRAGKKECIFEKESDYPSFDVKVLNLSLKPRDLTVQEYLEQCITKKAFNPFLICSTATSAQLSETEDVANAAKRIAPEALRVIGGPHVSALPIEYLKSSEYQVACIGEGVETLTEIALGSRAAMDEDLSRISGIAYRDGKGDVRLNAPRKTLFAIDEYPFPSDSLDLFLDDLNDARKNEKEIAYVFVGAGCPFRCVFCAQHAIHKGRVRERSARSIFAEIKKLYAKGFRRVAMVQETFLSHRGRIHDFCQLIENSNLTFQWTMEARADQLDFALLERMKDAGLGFIQVGVETGDQELLDLLGKEIELDQVKQLRDWCERLKIHTAFYMLVGLPGQDWQSILRSAVFLRDHTPYNRGTMHIPVSIAIPYPGTRIAEEDSVRFPADVEKTLNWPDRNPPVTVNEKGEFEGEGSTETDDMTSGEILEALTYLDDFGYFLLHARYDPSYTRVERAKARDFARRIFYMVERRTLHDLIVRAQEDLTPDGRRNAYLEMLEGDACKEMLLRDVTGSSHQRFNTFTDFLTAIKFTSGFRTMKTLSIPNRTKWMKLCAVLWDLEGRKWSRLGFERDDEREGKGLDGLLERLDAQTLDRALESLDKGNVPDLSEEDTTFYTLLMGKIQKMP
ncbi:MAG: radical SAM protein [Deltaproteobacteria bacterium]|nr:radical SAM protein [Deltaproteobacteria bacterium]